MNKYQAEAVEKGGSKRNKKLVIEPKQFSQMNKHKRTLVVVLALHAH